MLEEIPLSKPDITEREIERVVATMRSGRLSIGPMQELFERHIAQRTGRRHAIACSSGTMGLHMSLLALGIGPGDEVITTPFSFIASANCILYVGARPVFVDIDPRSLNMDPERVEAAITRRTKAILAVETFGNPAHMDAYRAIAARHEIPLIEDCCEGLGGAWKDRPVGAFGRVGVFGFYPNKQITTGEGGMVVTDDDRVADICRSLRNQGRAVNMTGSATGAWLCHERLGYNYRLPEINCALGVAQMERFDEIMAMRDRVANRYIERLIGVTDLMLPTIEPSSRMSWFVFVVRLRADYTREERDRIIAGMRRHDVGASDYFPCIHLQPFYRQMFGHHPGEFPIAESVSQRTIALPFHNRLAEHEQDFVVQTLELMLSRENIKRS
ncbi:MAG: DegT/DnrJ/EryC1/StrS family aminotransferase [Phycisphaeraceae bacterium]|nr:DegT/DnrJ/EryC1/StrS family aminotransferase [Phycisphaeraceae bacterium]